MRAALEERPRRDFAMPSGVVTATIDPASGLLAYEGQDDAIEEVFLEGTAPTETATPPDVLDSNSFLMNQFGADEAPSQEETGEEGAGEEGAGEDGAGEEREDGT